MLKQRNDLASRLSAIPRVALAHLPTPLEALSQPLAGRTVYIKRDDCTGLALGGNKTRKLQFTIADALAAGATTLLTTSGVQSNHVRQTAAAAARSGLGFHAVLAPALDHFPHTHVDSGNVLLDCLYGAALHLADSEEAAEARLAGLRDELAANGERPYVVPLGASDGIGSLGYVECALELLDQIGTRGLDVSHIFVPTGSGGTHAGLVAGLRLAGSDIKVVGISVSDPAEIKRDKVLTALADVGRVLGYSDLAAEAQDIIIHDDYAGGGYSHPTTEANHWIRHIARSDGLLLDPVYTGKAFAGMADLLCGETLPDAREVIFIHTGGAPTLFADPALLSDVAQDAPALLPLLARASR